MNGSDTDFEDFEDFDAYEDFQHFQHFQHFEHFEVFEDFEAFEDFEDLGDCEDFGAFWRNLEDLALLWLGFALAVLGFALALLLCFSISIRKSSSGVLPRGVPGGVTWCSRKSSRLMTF